MSTEKKLSLIASIQEGRLRGKGKKILILSKTGIEIITDGVQKEEFKIEGITKAFPYDSTRVIVITEIDSKTQIQVLNINTGTSFSFPLKTTDFVISGFKLSDPYTCLLNKNGILSILDISTGNEIVRARYSSDNETFATGFYHKKVITVFSSSNISDWNFNGKELILMNQVKIIKEEGKIRSCIRLTGNKFYYVCGPSYTLYSYENGKAQEVDFSIHHIDRIIGVSKLSKRKLIFSTFNTVQVWDFEKRKKLSLVKADLAYKAIPYTALSKKLILTLRQGVYIRIIDWKDKKILSNFPLPDSALDVMNFPFSRREVRINKCILILKLDAYLPKVLTLEVFDFI